MLRIITLFFSIIHHQQYYRTVSSLPSRTSYLSNIITTRIIDVIPTWDQQQSFLIAAGLFLDKTEAALMPLTRRKSLSCSSVFNSSTNSHQNENWNGIYWFKYNLNRLGGGTFSASEHRKRVSKGEITAITLP